MHQGWVLHTFGHLNAIIDLHFKATPGGVDGGGGGNEDNEEDGDEEDDQGM